MTAVQHNNLKSFCRSWPIDRRRLTMNEEQLLMASPEQVDGGYVSATLPIAHCLPTFAPGPEQSRCNVPCRWLVQPSLPRRARADLQ